MIWSIDGVEWQMPCQIVRTSEVKATDISGFMMNGSYFNDVMGTYMSYEIAVAVPLGMRDKYYDLYELLTGPVGNHQFVMPYSGGTIEFTGRIEKVSDEWVYHGEDNNWWKGVRFEVIANTPSKQLDADDLVNYGLPPTPQTSDAIVGDLYEYTQGGWQQSDIHSGDEEYY